MAFIPDTKYSIDGITYNTFYEAICAAKNIYPPEKTVVVTENTTKKVVFTRDGNPKKFHLYQYNVFYKTTADAGEMRTWLNDFAYSQAIDGTGALSNSRVNPIYINPATSLNEVYNKQEKASGGYYYVRSLSSIFTNAAYKQAKVSIDLRNIRTNLKSTNAYAILGVQSSKYTVEIGLHLADITGKGNYVWKVYKLFKDYDNKIEDWHWIGEVGNMGCNRTVTLEMVLSGETACCTATTDSSNVTFNFEATFSTSDPHGFYRMISLCPDKDRNHDTITPNLNCGDYFAGVSFKDCWIMQAHDMKYKKWPYNRPYNGEDLIEFTAAFNDQFIEVVPSTETVSISYKGRDLNNNLILS